MVKSKKTNQKTFRWASWKGRRGIVKALAISPDEKGRYIAFGGKGLRSGAIVVVDRVTGSVTHALSFAFIQYGYGVTSICFTHDSKGILFGTAQGHVKVWYYKSQKENDVQDVGNYHLTKKTN